MKQQRVAVIIPAYNESGRVGDAVKKTVKEGYTPIVVDDGSNDDTAAQAEQSGATVLRHIVNLGKGAAVKTGCDWALQQGADIIVLMDADGQHQPEDIKRLVRALTGVDIVFGYRKLDENMPLVMRLGNWAITTASALINGIAIKDTQSGFRTMTAQAYRKLRWRSNDYGMESEMIAKVAKRRLRYRQVPIDTIYLNSFKGTSIFDGINIMFRLLKWKLL